MNAEKLMTKECAYVRPSTSLNDAAHLMWQHDCGSLPVVDEQSKVLGMVTDRDVCMCSYHQGKSLKELTVEEAMSRRAVSCTAEDDIQTAQRLMREAQVRRLPVVDAEGHLSGLLTLAQIVRACGDGRGSDVTKAEVSETLAAICRPTPAARSAI